MLKVIREILALVWKLFVKVFWAWLKPILGRLFAIGLIVVLTLALLFVLIAR